MATFGVGIFDDDVARDVREAYRRLLASGRSDARVVRTLVGEFGYELESEVEPLFWLALAAVQWEYGRLQGSVCAAALDVIDSGAELNRWAGSPELERRRGVLRRLRAKLLSPQPPARTARLRRVHD